MMGNKCLSIPASNVLIRQKKDLALEEKLLRKNNEITVLVRQHLF